jgi:ribosomal protein S18 acetylase RimI-like enzyme
MPDLIDLRWSRAADAAALAEIYRSAWAYAYAGIIPGPALARMLGRRGPRWWRGLHLAGHRVLVIDSGAGPVGYAHFGRARRSAGGAGEIYELYVRPEHQGAGYGRRLFVEARARLEAAGHRRLVVWALADNGVGLRFYEAMGGQVYARSRARIGGTVLRTVGLLWS